jgi:glycosyltransferase involved in cell wall biosynthesis
VRIAVLNTHVPFVRGGAEQLADGLVGALRVAGHEVELLRLPFRWYPDQKILDHMLAAHMLRIPAADLVIGLKFPAYHVPHPNKVLWVLHQHRQAYDLWGTPWQGIADSAEGRAVRSAIFAADVRCLRQAQRVFTISGRVAARMQHFNGFAAEVLYPPLLDGGYRTGETGDYLFYPSRINVLKRQQLAVQAMRHVRSDVRLVLAGDADTPQDRRRLTEMLAEPELAGRVEWLDGWISHERKVELMAGALACMFIPLDEDYGYVTLESFTCAKAVITCTDSGGPLEFVQDGVTGVVAEPQAAALGEAIDRVAGDRVAARQMGAAALRRLPELGIAWANVVQRLTAS